MKLYESLSLETLSKKSKDKKLNEAIEMAEIDKNLTAEIEQSKVNAEAKEGHKSLLSIDDELKLIKTTEEAVEGKKKIETSYKTPKRRLAKTAPDSENCASRKRNSHLAAVLVDTLCKVYNFLSFSFSSYLMMYLHDQLIFKAKFEDFDVSSGVLPAAESSKKKWSSKELDEVLQTTRKKVNFVYSKNGLT